MRFDRHFHTESNQVENDANIEYLHELAYKKSTPYEFIADDVSSNIEIDAYKLYQYFFLKRYKEIPHKFILPLNLDLKTFINYVFEKYDLLHKSIYSSRGEFVFVSRDDQYAIHVYIDTNDINNNILKEVVLYARRTCNVEKAVKKFKTFTSTEKQKPSIGVFVKEFGEVIVKDYNLDISKYVFDESLYNEDFVAAAAQIESKLNAKEAGLYLLHGAPGTGKSSYIRYLSSVVNRKFIYVPPSMVDVVFSVDLLGMFIGDLKGSVLIVEDAEKVLLQRDASDGYHNSSNISTILNTTDGLYSDLTKLSIICTYNCDRNSIDKAFLRKGRLKYEYMFKSLSVERAKLVAKNRNISKDITSPITLAELLNEEDISVDGTTDNSKEKRVGFFV